MTIRRIFGGLLTAGGLAATVLVGGPATQANAAVALTCTVGSLCLWDTPAGAGYWGDAGPQDRSSVGSFNDKASVASNRTGAYICLYEDAGWVGNHAVRLPRHMTVAFSLDLTFSDGFNFDNKTSSYKRVADNPTHTCPGASRTLVLTQTGAIQR